MSDPTIRPSRQGKRSAIWLVVGTLVVVLILLTGVGSVALLRPREPLQVPGAQVVRLDDGREIFVHVTYGQSHRWSAEVGQERSLENLFSPTRDVAEDRDTPRNMYCIWLAGAHPVSGKPYDFSWWAYSSVVDQYGVEIRDQDGYRHYQQFDRYGYGSGTSSGSRPMGPFEEEASVIVVSSALPTFHEAKKTFTLRLHDTTGKVMAQVNLPRTHAVPGTPWQADPLPATSNAGDLAVTLKSVTFQEYKSDDPLDQRPVFRVRPEFEFVWQGAPSQDWYARSSLSDQLGNTDYSHDVHLSPHGGAWKLHVNLIRKDDARFTPQEMWQAPELILPAAKTHQIISDAGLADRVKVSLLAIGGTGAVNYALPIAEDRSGSSSSSGSITLSDNRQVHYNIEIDYRNRQAQISVSPELPHISLKAPLANNQELLVRAVDDQGREVPTTSREYHGITVVLLGTEADAKSVQPTFIVHEPRQLEFLIDPPQ